MIALAVCATLLLWTPTRTALATHALLPFVSSVALHMVVVNPQDYVWDAELIATLTFTLGRLVTVVERLSCYRDEELCVQVVMPTNGTTTCFLDDVPNALPLNLTGILSLNVWCALNLTAKSVFHVVIPTAVYVNTVQIAKVDFYILIMLLDDAKSVNDKFAEAAL